MNEELESKSIDDLMKSVWDTLDRMSKRADEREAKLDAEFARRQIEADQRKADLDAEFAKRQIEADQRKADLEAELAKRKADLDAELSKRQAKLDAELAKQKAEFDAEFARRQAEAEKVKAEFDAEIKKINQMMGNQSHNIGIIAEEYFYNSFANGKTNFFGEKFDEIEKRVNGIKKGFKDEYDILLINGETIGIIEVKHKANENDIPQVLRKAKTFRVNFPDYKNHKVYLGLASMAFYPDLEAKCKENGIAIIKQLGETLIITDEHLKEY
ncbi:MAG: hypothetical protein FWG98_10670 [Candidatus Cloacimonetes bacterium]|nr:hypothetical protein [Candidatus Cloacimonadota bacterium]